MNRRWMTWLANAGTSTSLGFLALLFCVNTAQAQVVEAPKVEVQVPADAPKSVEDATREAQQEARDAADNAREAARDRAQDAREGARDAARDARNTAPAANDAARDRVQDAREQARDVNEAARDTVRDTRETVRDANEAVRDAARETRDTVREMRGTFRDARGRVRPENMRSADIGIWFGRANNEGLLVTDVNTTGAIANAGFHEGDRIVSINGQRVAREVDFMRHAFASNARNEKVKVIILRDAKEEEIWLEPQVFIQEVSAASNNPVEDLGLILDDRVSDRLIVWRVVPRSPAFFGGVRAGDEIVKFEGQGVEKPSDLAAVVEKTNSGTATIEVKRNDREREIELDLTASVDNSDGRRTTFRQNLDDNNPNTEVRGTSPQRRTTTAPAPRRGIFSRRGR